MFALPAASRARSPARLSQHREFEDASQPWLVTTHVRNERELAVYCVNCAQPHRARHAEPQRDGSTSVTVAST
jgi:hypothetical protein